MKPRSKIKIKIKGKEYYLMKPRSREQRWELRGRGRDQEGKKKKKKKPSDLEILVDFVCGFDKEEERVIGVFRFRDESGEWSDWSLMRVSWSWAWVRQRGREWGIEGLRGEMMRVWESDCLVS